ncbi:uncharacterized protein TNCV_1352821 [Trichonephila clavipes]|nr:uncharacterized protein TNCV_1352821 [Trichonephila clavipes]
MACRSLIWVTFCTCVVFCAASPTRRQFISITETTSSEPVVVVTKEGAVWDDNDDFDLDVSVRFIGFNSNGHQVAAVAEWYRYRIVACLVTSSSPVPLKTRRVGQRCTLKLSGDETSSRWCGVVVRRGGASSGVVHVT